MSQNATNIISRFTKFEKFKNCLRKPIHLPFIGYPYCCEYFINLWNYLGIQGSKRRSLTWYYYEYLPNKIAFLNITLETSWINVLGSFCNLNESSCIITEVCWVWKIILFEMSAVKIFIFSIILMVKLFQCFTFVGKLHQGR